MGVGAGRCNEFITPIFIIYFILKSYKLFKITFILIRIYGWVTLCARAHTHTHTHTHVFVRMRICMCVGVSKEREREREREREYQINDARLGSRGGGVYHFLFYDCSHKLSVNSMQLLKWLYILTLFMYRCESDYRPFEMHWVSGAYYSIFHHSVSPQRTHGLANRIHLLTHARRTAERKHKLVKAGSAFYDYTPGR